MTCPFGTFFGTFIIKARDQQRVNMRRERVERYLLDDEMANNLEEASEACR